MAEYAYTDSDGQGHLPIGDAAHVRNALARFGQTFFESEEKARAAWSHIQAAAKKFGIEADASMPTPKIKKPSEGYKKASADLQLATFAVAIPDVAPEWIQLMPAGRFNAIDGRGPFENVDPEKLIAASIARMPEVGAVIDYDHSTDLAAPEGRPAIAAGWIKELKAENGAIFARIEWTQQAAEKIASKEYRYISPVFEHAKDGTVERILRAALTNNPALTQLPAIAAAQRQTMAKKKKFSDVIAAMEAAHPDGTPAQHVAAARCYGYDMGDAQDGDPMAVDAGNSPGDGHAEPDGDEGMAHMAEDEEAMTSRHAEEMAKCASDEEREACRSKHMAEKEAMAKQVKGLEVKNKNEKSHMSAQKIDVDAIVAKHPMVVKMASEINAMRTAQAKAEATQKVDAAIREGRLIPSQRDWAISYCTADGAGFEKFIGAQPKIIQQGSDGTFTGRIGEAPKGATAFSEKQVEIFANLGLESDEQLQRCAAVQQKWTLKFPRPRLMLDDSNGGTPDNK